MPKLKDPRQEAFCNEYLIDLNQTKAALRATYAESSARQSASRLMSKDNIQERIRELNADRKKATKVDAEYVLTRLQEINELDVIDILNDELDAFRPLNEWPKSWRISISGIDLQHIVGGGDDPIDKVIKKIKWPDKTKNLELLGRHVDIQAFKDRVEHSADDDLAHLIQQGRDRAVKNEKS